MRSHSDESHGDDVHVLTIPAFLDAWFLPSWISLTRAIKARYAALNAMEADGLYRISKGLTDEGFPHCRAVTNAVERPPAAAADPSSSARHGQADSVSLAEDTYPPTQIKTVKMFNTWRLYKAREKGRGYHLPAGGRKSISLAPLVFAPQDDESDDDDKTSPASPEAHKESHGGPHRRKTLSRRLNNMSTHLAQPFLDRFDARFLPMDDERPSPIDEACDSSVPSPVERPGLPHAPVEEAFIDSLVRPHVGPQPWTDAPSHDKKYSYQPPYFDKVPTTLWLPRHPLSRLDVDDSVDVRASLESSYGGDGKLGASELFTIERRPSEPVLRDSPEEMDPGAESPPTDEQEGDGLSPVSDRSRPSAKQKDYFLSVPVDPPFEPSVPPPLSSFLAVQVD